MVQIIMGMFLMCGYDTITHGRRLTGMQLRHGGKTSVQKTHTQKTHNIFHVYCSNAFEWLFVVNSGQKYGDMGCITNMVNLPCLGVS